jgi:hypothetical protein
MGFIYVVSYDRINKKHFDISIVFYVVVVVFFFLGFWRYRLNYFTILEIIIYYCGIMVD